MSLTCIKPGCKSKTFEAEIPVPSFNKTGRRLRQSVNPKRMELTVIIEYELAKVTCSKCGTEQHFRVEVEMVAPCLEIEAVGDV